MLKNFGFIAFFAVCAASTAEPASWFDAAFDAVSRADRPAPKPARIVTDWGRSDVTVCAWINTRTDGAIAARQIPGRAWAPHEKALFIRGGRLCYDIGYVGCIESRPRIADGAWHHVALVNRLDREEQRLFVDGREVADGSMETKPDPAGCALLIGRGANNFPETTDFKGMIEDVRIYRRALSAAEVKADAAADTPLAGCDLHLPLHAEREPSWTAGDVRGAIAFGEGRRSKALQLKGGSHLALAGGSASLLDRLWPDLEKRHPDATSLQEMRWEREDGIWTADPTPAELAARYADASRIHGGTAAAPTAGGTGREAVEAVRRSYLEARRFEVAAQRGRAEDLDAVRTAIRASAQRYAGRYDAKPFFAKLDELERQRDGWAPATTTAADLDAWRTTLGALRYDALIQASPDLDFDKILFVKRLTYNANHYYTEFINSAWMPGGNLCVLDLKTGAVREVVPQLKGGVFERFDLSFDAKKVVFAWKAGPQVGYRIYEVNLDGTGLRQLTFPPDNEADLVEQFRVFGHYHHGTDDMQPCYLPDGGIAFISTRCQYGILCDQPDDFTTTVLYRMDADGRNMEKLSNSSVSEASPVMLPDGRLLYTRWEYVDKGAVSVKCLWAMRPDGTFSSEIYGNDIPFPPTMIYGRPIPGHPNRYVMIGAPHYPQNGVGPVIRLDMSKNIRTRDPMTYMTPYVDIQAEGGFAFREGDGPWKQDGQGRGPLFKDPYPLSDSLFLVSHKPAGAPWNDPKGYALYLLDETGGVVPVYRDPEISCWLPYPVKPRPVPPVLPVQKDPALAAAGEAQCLVSDVYLGLKDVPCGSIRHIRILEQVPRPWAARRRWSGDAYDQQHACVTKDTHLGLKVQHGVVPVEDDGSASFVVPADANIFFQALDANYMAVQTERTFVNYRPGEVRSCIGCHETPGSVSVTDAPRAPKAFHRPPSVPGPQPGETSGRRPLDYAADVQPVWDRHCVKCHSGPDAKGKLDLSGAMTALFNVSYENLVPERRRAPRRDRGLLGPVIGENHPKTGNVDYLPARSLGSHASVLVAMLCPDAVKLEDPEDAARARKLAEVHKDVRLATEERIRVTNWIDTNAQYYGSYWGRKNLQHKDHPDFRPVPTFDTARSMTPPAPKGQSAAAGK